MTTAIAELRTAEPQKGTGRISRGDRIFRAVITAIVYIVLAIFTGVLTVLIVGAWPAMKRFGPGFIIHTGW